MAARILFLYSTVDGHTRKICARLQQVVEENGHCAALASLDDASPIDLESFDKIVVGASIRYGRHRPRVIEFMNSNKHILQGKPSAFFSVNVVARKTGKNTPQTNPYMRKILRQFTWRPGELAVFAGMLDYPKYGFLERTIIRFIMAITRGPTDPNTVVEFTDWEEVERFGRVICNMVSRGGGRIPGL